MLKRITLVVCLVAIAGFGCTAKSDKAPEAKGEHKAYHNGCLNAMGSCENGHAEVRVEGETAKLWFVGGGNDTDKVVRIPDAEFTLSVAVEGEKVSRTLEFKAKPNELAEERIGDCSHFEASADWLKDAKKFVATGEVTFKGKKQAVRIEFPAGYDPD